MYNTGYNTGAPLVEQSLHTAATLDALAEVHRALEDFWQQARQLVRPAPADAAGHAITTAAMEIAANIVRHAYPDSASRGSLQMDLSLYADHIEISFYDQGLAFKEPPLEPVVDPDLLALLPEGGLGLFLVHRALDELRYVRIDERTNHWRLVKYF